MKTRITKLLSFALTLVMLVSMIPMGMITANAVVLDANATEYVITSVDDWNAIASAELATLKGKTIKLGSDIDANGQALPTLTAFDNMTFDGCGYTIKNVTSTKAILSNMFMDNSVIKNVKLDNVHVNGTGELGILVSVISTTAANTSTKIENVIATNCSVTATAGTKVGGLIGRVSMNTGAFELKNLSFSGNVTTDGNYAGGIIGSITTNVSMLIDGMYYNGTLSNMTAATGSDTQYTYATGGAIAHLTTKSGFTGELTVKDVYVTGALNSRTTAIAGVIGFAHIQGGNLNFYNMVVNFNTYDTADIYCRSVFANLRSAFNLNYANLYSNVGGYTGGGLKWYALDLWQGHNYITVNGNKQRFVNGTFIYNNHKDIVNTYVDMEDKKIDLTKVLKIDGFEITVLDHIYANAIQYSEVKDGEFAVRFIAKSQRTDLTATNVTMNIILETTGGVKKSYTKQSYLYDTLTEYNEKGIQARKTAAEYDAQKLAALTIYGIPVNDGETITFTVTTYYTCMDENVVTGTHTMTVSFINGQLVQN